MLPLTQCATRAVTREQVWVGLPQSYWALDMVFSHPSPSKLLAVRQHPAQRRFLSCGSAVLEFEPLQVSRGEKVSQMQRVNIYRHRSQNNAENSGHPEGIKASWCWSAPYINPTKQTETLISQEKVLPCHPWEILLFNP